MNKFEKAKEAADWLNSNSEYHVTTRNVGGRASLVFDLGTDISPCLYVEDTHVDIPVHLLASQMIDAVKNSMDNLSEITEAKNLLQDWNYVKEHLKLAVYRLDINLPKVMQKDENYFKVAPFVEFDNAKVNVPVTAPQVWHVSEETIWSRAKENTADADYTFESIRKTLEKMHMPVPEEDPEYPLMDIVTNDKKQYTSGILACPETLRNFLDAQNVYEKKDLVILPSSIHEILVVPINPNIELERLSDMVREINAAKLAFHEQVADTAFILTVDGELLSTEDYALKLNNAKA